MHYLSTQAVNTFYQLVKSAQTIIIHRHQRPDPDAIGSQLGLKALLHGAFPDKRILAAGTTSQGLSFLGQMDKVVLSDYEDALVIITDTANLDRVDGPHYDKGKTLIKIDHHPPVESYGDLQIVHPEASSCSEVIALMALTLDQALPLNLPAARLLYAGIVGDTGRFMFSSTTAITFEVTSQLVMQGVDTFAINDAFNIMEREDLPLLAYAYQHLAFTPYGVGHLIIRQQLIQSLGITEEKTNMLVNIASRVSGIKAWVTFVEQAGDPSFYRCRIRSKGPVINDISAQHGGGGHPLAAGANAYSLEEIDAIIEKLNQAVLAYEAKSQTGDQA